MGLDINYADGKTLLIRAVDSGGLFCSWNDAASPEEQVGPGFRILEVNGISGNSAALLDECRKLQLLRLVIERPPEAFFNGATVQYFDCGDSLEDSASSTQQAQSQWLPKGIS